MRRRVNHILLCSVIVFGLLVSCKENTVPKSRGYLRIDLPKSTTYSKYDASIPFAFETSEYSSVYQSKKNENKSWFNVDYSTWKGRIYLSYFQLNDTSLNALIEDSRRFAYKHTIKASSIEESMFSFQSKQVYGILYDIGGDVASSVQFYATDSTNHFLMGSLYFNCEPNRDSLNPVISYIRQDVLHLIETLEWKN